MTGPLKCTHATRTHFQRSSLNCFHCFLLQGNHRQPLHDFSPWKCISGTMQWNLDPVSIPGFTLAGTWLLSEVIAMAFLAKTVSEFYRSMPPYNVYSVSGRGSHRWVLPCGVIFGIPQTGCGNKNCIVSVGGVGHLFQEGPGRCTHCLVATSTAKQGSQTHP